MAIADDELGDAEIEVLEERLERLDFDKEGKDQVNHAYTKISCPRVGRNLISDQPVKRVPWPRSSANRYLHRHAEI